MSNTEFRMMKEKSGFIIYYSLFVIRNSLNLNIECRTPNFEFRMMK